MTTTLMAETVAPAGGSPTGQVVIATAAAAVVLTALIVTGLARRAGRRVPLLDAGERLGVRLTGLPGWAAVPVGLAAGSLLCAVFGLYWDVSLHMDRGRDEGPLANPSHFFILAGLLGIFAAGWLAVVMPARGERPGRAAVRLSHDWYAPVGGLVMMACASFAALGFPLDDVWHRLFGQDVTLWGPTHMMMLTGAALTLVGIIILMREGRQAAPSAGRTPTGPLSSAAVKMTLATGGVLVGLSIYQGEFDYGAPQYRLLFHPALIALAASGALVAARMLGGRGAALGAVAFYLLVRGTLTVLVGPVFGESTAHFPLFVAEALLVEAVALRVRSAYRFALAAGALIGTVGTMAELGWSRVWMPVAWPLDLLPEAVAVALPVALAGALIGAFLADPERVRPAAAAGSVAVVAALFAALVPTSVPDARGSVTLTEVTPAPDRTVHATMRVSPPDAVQDADWLRSIAWQGGGHVEGAPLERIGPGVYRTTEPLPVSGTWKSALRFHRGGQLASIPVFMPADRGIPAAELPAPARFERPFTADHEILQRERGPGATGAMWIAANLLVTSTILGLLAILGWALRRVGLPPAAATVAPRRVRPRVEESA